MMRNKKSKFLIICIIFLVLCTVFNTFSAPITIYDTDLNAELREQLQEAYENRQNKSKLIDENNSNEDNSNEYKSTTGTIEDEYLEYENNSYSSYYVATNSYVLDDTYNHRIINKNIPDLDVKDYDGVAFEKYSDLDSLGRCGVAIALLGKETMPSVGEVRGPIGMVKPSGWQTPQKKYDFIDGKFLYNRCHLIGWQLSKENDNIKNLITGTRWLNTRGMLPIENMVANYIRTTNNHVIYKVTPIFESNNLVASRIHIEALSYEDNGLGIKINILLDNYQPGVHIDYLTGESYEENVNQ